MCKFFSRIFMKNVHEKSKIVDFEKKKKKNSNKYYIRFFHG